ncbi:hypothetical protein [Mycolicibacterium monacense]|uniref:Scaffolding protein n=1 Tax=Mycolicibacterium monacense TaxID=85693 RepID=A0AAD1J3D1_MYCMB|nr:hypothetical protein [Mycolicibacterium monacense]MDA4103518.1 hypothetical protein [Mycolicibacterium monacense DSM 44395]ORB12711.1 hypothetical protein BST34_26310 [Mycolicibacterium monacense DSM 44395]QHP83885.1 hypothetical protein EWR22_00095 [Mycolicibacterium monacense DSM 44395]BBZ63421.1 hypothetical protein MMON_47220 [Mycolicibacterium monacense]
MTDSTNEFDPVDLDTFNAAADTAGDTTDSEERESADPAADDIDAADSEPDNGNREAAKYRRRLRDTEAERDTLAARLEGMQRAEAERLAGKMLAKGAALWAGGTTIADLLNEAGELDPDKVQTRAAEIREQFGIPQPRSGLHVPREGYSPATSGRSGADSMVNVVMGREQ